jgi:hypothetical protein
MNVDMKFQTQENAIFCNMDVFTQLERENHVQNTVRLFQTVEDIHDAENGFVFLFPQTNSSENISRFAEFIFNERRCCPFLEFTLKVAPNDGPISLLLSGPEGTREFLHEEFSEAFS